MPRILAVVLAALLGSPLAATAVIAADTPPGARVFFTNVQDGDTVPTPFTVQFGAEGVKVAKAGVCIPSVGHHHLLLNTIFDESYLGWAVPDDAKHRHFSSGQTETTLYLQPGRYTLQLVFADCDHVPYQNPPLVSDVITITVQ